MYYLVIFQELFCVFTCGLRSSQSHVQSLKLIPSRSPCVCCSRQILHKKKTFEMILHTLKMNNQWECAMKPTSAAVGKVKCSIEFFLFCEIYFTVSVMAFSSTTDSPSDVPFSKLRRWSSVGVRLRTSSFDHRMVCPRLINYTNSINWQRETMLSGQLPCPLNFFSIKLQL